MPFGLQTLPIDRLFFIRHAQSEGNLKGLFHSNKLDWPLTEKGQAQAKAAARVLETLPVTAVLSSPLRRVQQTIAPYLAGRQTTLNHTRDDRLIERDFAGIEGMKIPLDRNFFIEDPKGVEPTAVFIERVFAGLNDHLTEDHTLFAAHAGVMHALMLGLGLDLDPWEGPYNNATPTLIERQGQKWHVQHWDFKANAWRTPPPATRDWTT